MLRPLVIFGFLGWLSSAALAQGVTTERVSVATGGAEANALSYPVGMSDDGRYFAFYSDATNLVPGDVNGSRDAFVHDRLTATTELVSVSSAGDPGNAGSGVGGYGIAISRDGRYVAFHSDATNLVPGDTNGASDVFLRDRSTGTTERVSVSTTGQEANGGSRPYAIALSPDGRYVLFTSEATNLVPSDTNGVLDVFLRDRQSGTTELISVATGGSQGDAMSGWTGLSMTPDGRFVAFESFASNLDWPPATGQSSNLFLRDRQLLTTHEVWNDGYNCFTPSLTPDGRFLSFEAGISVPHGVVSAVRVLDRQTNRLDDIWEWGSDCYHPAISDDGRHVVYNKDFWDGAPGQILLDDLTNRTSTSVCVSTSGVPGNQGGAFGVVSGDARFVAFSSDSTNLVPGDTNGARDVFVRGPHVGSFTRLCSPGAEGVIACPCANPPSSEDRGCDNSSGTGGAQLFASGSAGLTADTIVFFTEGERPAATSVLLQGTRGNSTGAAFGQGVRCVGGVFKRLYTKTASAGSISVPDLGAGDLPVSARSAALGDSIRAGEGRWYAVYYRDPIVLGGCPASSTFNVTSTVKVDWLL